MLEVLLTGFVMDIIKALVAFGGAWVALRLADRAMGVDFNTRIYNMTDTGFGIYSAGRWMAIALIISYAFL